MRIVCAWMYAIGKYGFPPEIEDIKHALVEMREMGFDYVEAEGIGVDNLASVVHHRNDIQAVIRDNGLELADFAVLLPDIISMSDDRRDHALQWFEKGVETAALLGSPYVWIDSYFPPLVVQQGVLPTEDLVYGQSFKVRVPDTFSWEKFWDRFVDSIARCNEISKVHGVGLLVEPRVGEVIANTESMLRLADAINDSNLGFILDTAHQHAQKEILPLAIEKLGNHLRYVHVADNDGRDNHHLPPGDGTIDWDELFRTLSKRGFDGFFAIDLEKTEQLDQAFVASKAFLERYAEKYSF